MIGNGKLRGHNMSDEKIPWWELPGAPGENRTKEQYNAEMAALKERNPSLPKRCPATRQVFEIVLASLNYDGDDINSLTVGEIRRALP